MIQLSQRNREVKSIILTGASGFVGGCFFREYSQTYQIKTINLRETPVEEIPFQGVDSIVHCAALVHQMKGAPDDLYFEVNFELTKRLALQAKQAGVEHFVFLSTVFVYGTEGGMTAGLSLNETSPCEPSGAYGRSKLAAENFLLSLVDAKFKVAIIRQPMVY